MFVRLILLFIFVFALSKKTFTQEKKGVNDTILLGAVVVDGDTFPHVVLRDVIIKDIAPKWAIKERRQQQKQAQAYERLRYNVYVTYPYAVAASFVLHDIDSAMNTIYSKDAKKIYKERKEAELNKRFKGELENLTVEQGQILVKLVARETGKPVYQIIKELKGGFNARIWQTVAILFSNNLKNRYDATGDDAAIESVVQEILSRGHFEMKR
ncbi:MAG: DUF4294 domain-containing protein [Chitinophagaceae bacterium]|nr:DUF4294 domain-containing protein [Chitinophagaceae bacterium]HMN32378.1 DUF4294 domain-containing protein [Chitinophagaceae bacterium]